MKTTVTKTMTMTKRLLLMGVGVLFLSGECPAQSALNFWESDIWKEADRGFLFYGPFERKEKNETEKDQEAPVDLKSLTTLEALQAERDKRLHRAIMTPTPEAMARYQEINTFMLEKSAMFADLWRRSLWSHPQFDFTTQHPAANFAQVALTQKRITTKTDVVKNLSDDWGLVFVVNTDCEFCDLMAPINDLLQKEYGLQTLAINVSPKPSPSWPQARPDNGTLRRLVGLSGEPITTTPTLFMVHRNQQTVHRVATGVVSVEELVQRLYTLAAVKPGESLFGGKSE